MRIPRRGIFIGISVVVFVTIAACGVLWGFVKMFSGRTIISPPQTWVHTLPSGSQFEFTSQVIQRTGWGTDSGGRTEVSYLPSYASQPEHVGELPYVLRPELFSESTAVIYEADDVVLFVASRKVFIRQGGKWGAYSFSYSSFPGQGSPLLDGKIDFSSGHEGHFKFIGVEPQGPALKVLYSDAVGSWLLVYTIVDETEPLRLVEATPFGQQH